MVTEFKIGLIHLGMKVNGQMIKQMVKESWSMQMAMFMRDNGLMIRLMVKGSILIQMEHTMLEIGWMINKVELEWKVGLMVPSTREII